MVVASMKDDARGELLALADAGLRHAEGLSAQLERPDWKPSRAHIEQSRNSIKRLAEALRPAPVPQCEAEPDAQDAIKPHLHVPDLETMGDCRVCGHPRKSPWHIATPPSRSDAESAPVAWREAVESFIEHLRPVQQVFNRDGTVQASWAVDGRKWFTIDFTKALRILENASLVPPPSEAGRALEEIEAEAERYAEMYSPHSDGRNTFVIFGNFIRSKRRALSTDPGTVAVASTLREAPHET